MRVGLAGDAESFQVEGNSGAVKSHERLKPIAVNRRYPPAAFVLAMTGRFGNPDSRTDSVVASAGVASSSRQNRMLLGQGAVSENHRERRAMRRFSMKLPASVRVSGIPTEFPTETENVSARGIFFHLDRWIAEGARVEVTMAFPRQVTL